MRFVVLTGGVCSSIGKGHLLTALASLTPSPNIIKIDPYLNIHAGNLSPEEHGEVYILEDGWQVDQDFGTYEHGVEDLHPLTTKNSVTGGKVYERLLKGDTVGGPYFGSTLQTCHTVEIARDLIVEGSVPDTTNFIELGGTVGNKESVLFLNALALLAKDHDVTFCHLVYVPDVVGTQKTMPAQDSVEKLSIYRIAPDFVFMRAKTEIEPGPVSKIARAFHLEKDRLISIPDMDRPELLSSFLEDRRDLILSREETRVPPSLEFRRLDLKIAVVGKYAKCADAYHSILRALASAGVPSVHTMAPEEFKTKSLDDYDGFVAPGGFGARAFEDTVEAVSRIRESGKPFLGICLGMQCALVAFARSILGYGNSEEFAEGSHLISRVNPDRSMNLGDSDVTLEGRKAREVWGDESTFRFRHRFAMLIPHVPPELTPFVSGTAVTDAGVPFVACIEDPDLPFFVGTQFHPEFGKNGSPIFKSFVDACL